MRVQELVDIARSQKNQMLKPEQLQTVLKKELEVKEYIGIKDKKELINSIISECILYSNGVYKFDEIEKYICFTMKTIEAYTNLELSDDMEADYDVLCEEGLLDTVIGCFKSEYDAVSILLQMRTDYFLSENTIQVQIGRIADELLEKIQDMASNIMNSMENFDLSKLPIKKDDLEELFALIK